MEIRRFSESDNINDVSRVYALSWKLAYVGIVSQDYLDSISEDQWSKILVNELSNMWIVSEGQQIVS